jgi:hypothetical protein
MPSKTICQAEKAALDGANESQDTLVIAHCLMMNYGVGLVSVALQGDHNLEANHLRHCAEKQLATSWRTTVSPFTQAKPTTQRNRQNKQCD